MSDKPEESKPNERQNNEDERSNVNSIETCAGGLTEEQLRTLQDDLDRAKEDNSFSSSSRCVIG